MSVEANELKVAPFKEEKEQMHELPVLEQSVTSLAKFGGFDFLEAIVDGADNLNPVRKAKRNIFLTDSGKKDQRQQLKKKMVLWIDLLSNSETVSEMVDKCNERADISEKLLKGNLKKILATTHELEQSYRSVHLFYKNTESSKLKNVVLMNASMDQLTDLDEPRYIEYIAAELKQKFDRLDLRQNYSLLVIPGYLKSNAIVDKWAKMAYNNKVMLVPILQILKPLMMCLICLQTPILPVETLIRQTL